jgi:hypothetical protein
MPAETAKRRARRPRHVVSGPSAKLLTAVMNSGASTRGRKQDAAKRREASRRYYME